MPWYPGARRYDVRRDRGYTGRGRARRITAVRINHHTAVVDRDDLDGQASNLSMPYPHFMMGEGGEVTQYQDTDFMARADLDGNPSTISIETWDGYPKGAAGYWRHNGDVPPWTAKQVRALIELDAWILQNHKAIPLRLARDSRPGESSKGLSWHRLGCDGNFPDAWPFWGRRSGGARYSTAFGKVCPGDRRIRQLVDVIYPALQGIRPDDKEEDIMATLPELRTELDAALASPAFRAVLEDVVLNAPIPVTRGGRSTTRTLQVVLSSVDADQQRQNEADAR